MPALKRKTVLVIEDEDDIRALMCRVLRMMGYRTLRAAAGYAGARLMSEQQVDLVLLDLRLPDCSGWNVLQRMKSSPALSHIPVIVATASAEASLRNRTLAMGVQRYLVKPFGVGVLEQAINGVMSER